MRYTKHNTKIYLQKQTGRSVSYIVYRISCKGDRRNLSSGIFVTDNTQWDETNRRIKHGIKINGTPYNILNNQIKTHESFIDNYFNDCDARDLEPSLDELIDRFHHAFKDTSKKPIIEGVAIEDEFSYLFDQYVELKSKERSWDDSMKDKHERLKNRILKVKPDMRLTDLSESMMNKLLDEFATTMFNDAITIQISSLKRFVRWAKNKKYPVNEDCLNFEPKLPSAKKAVRFLTLEELDTIRTLDLTSKGYLDRAKDFFLFQCGTALRYSDLKQLTRNNISVDEDGNYILTKLTEKDDDVIHFPLCSIAKEVYLKYKDNEYDKGALFPVISNQKYNDYLKEIGDLAKLEGDWVDYEYKLNKKIEVRTPKKDLTSHTARRTFVVTAINEGVSPELVALVTSHSDLKAMQPYIKINPKGTKKVVDAVDEAMKKKH